MGVHRKKARKAIELSWQLTDKLRKENDKLGREKTDNKQQKNSTKPFSEEFGSDIHYLYQSQKELKYFEELSTSTKAQLTNNPFLLFTGVAGSGKTHLLCDILKNRSFKDNPLPTVLVFGERFVSGKDIFKQIIDQLGLNLSTQRFLQLLDHAGRNCNCRALLIIDALNETRSRNFWKRNLTKIVGKIKGYSNIALVVSLRSGFEKEVITKKTEKHFVKEDHPGFQFREWEAVSKFFNEFNLPLPEIPLLMPEFQNPLFLLLFCKAFENRKKRISKGKNKQIFRGHEGATYVFEAFVDSVSKKITKQFGISNTGNNNIWDRVIEKIAEEMVNSNDERISENQLLTIVQNGYMVLTPFCRHD